MYTDQRVEYDLGTMDITGTTAAVLTPGHQPFRVRAVAIALDTGLATSGAVITISKRVTPGSDTSKVDIDTLTIPVSGAAGHVYYNDSLNTKISPGEQLSIVSDGVPSAGSGRVIAVVEPAWESPDNNTDMTSVTS
jgi:hypothetical protein